MSLKNITEYTENEFLNFVKKICAVDYRTEQEHTNAVFEFERISEHPSGSDLFYFPEPGHEATPEAIVNIVKTWRIVNGKPGFKHE